MQDEFPNSQRSVNKLTVAPSRISESVFLRRRDSNLCVRELWKRQIEIRIAKDLWEVRQGYHGAQLKPDVLISRVLSCASQSSCVAEKL